MFPKRMSYIVDLQVPCATFLVTGNKKSTCSVRRTWRWYNKDLISEEICFYCLCWCFWIASHTEELENWELWPGWRAPWTQGPSTMCPRTIYIRYRICQLWDAPWNMPKFSTGTMSFTKFICHPRKGSYASHLSLFFDMHAYSSRQVYFSSYYCSPL